jgi:hypothetical protein
MNKINVKYLMFFILLFNTINGFNIDLVDEVVKYSNFLRWAFYLVILNINQITSPIIKTITIA